LKKRLEAVDDRDRSLVRRCVDGHTEAFDELVDRYQRPLFNVALRMLNNAEDAEDVTQTVFCNAFVKLATYDPKYRFFSWIYRMTVNESINCLERGRREDALDDTLGARLAAPHRSLDATEAEELVGTALTHLRPEDRAIVVLKHFLGFSYKEIEVILEVPIKTVKSRLYAARQRLREILLARGMEGSDG
jgi:RNA polymerase sigma-70 factor (ECF subfamily)